MDVSQPPSASAETKPASETTYVVEPAAQHTHTFILLHGLGSNGTKFGEEFLRTGKTSAGKTLPEAFPGARFVFPTAKRRRSAAFGRRKLTQWFNIAYLADPNYLKEMQLPGLEESAAEIRELLLRERELVPSTNIILGGISQGCAMSLTVLLTLEYPLAGCLGMCGYLPFQEDIEEAVAGHEDSDDDDNPFAPSADSDKPPDSPRTKAFLFERDLLCIDAPPDATVARPAVVTPIFLGHGDCDEKKPHALGEAAARTMRAAGYTVDWNLYAGLGHWYKIPEEIDDIVRFIGEKVGWGMAEQ
ncbi:putative acyl-protein thioesterase [Rosellinia necatrix]|uniref:Acyl-protein thioesterase 1 n=1 Tax=Rosellinia necatrix TaxID=77044 RepID=A0A1W2TT22_ROSNE|nr:putative acyl-protein thioesterase [Rosellinia necatrix]